MASMGYSAARSLFRSSSVRKAASKFASASKTSSFRSPSATNLLSSSRIFRCPAELSACLETMQPFHTATASALMTSMLSVSSLTTAWLPNVCKLKLQTNDEAIREEQSPRVKSICFETRICSAQGIEVYRKNFEYSSFEVRELQTSNKAAAAGT
ncbi:hypothetical protein KSS87_019604 [Heliosperma pusillum]|nr:hypothetical protein KSS87_019604 [Heliosperma pusillum]